MWMSILVFAVFGAIAIISPRISWHVSNWWRLEGEGKPRPVSLLFYRISGLFFLIASFVLICVEL